MPVIPSPFLRSRVKAHATRPVEKGRENRREGVQEGEEVFIQELGRLSKKSFEDTFKTQGLFLQDQSGVD